MSTIGTFGGVVFSCSESYNLRPTSVQRSGGAVWADHDRIKNKPKREFMHSEIRKVDIDITLMASMGVRPRSMLDLLYSYCESGSVFPLIIGSAPVSSYNMAIMSVSDTWDSIIRDGKLSQATVSVSFEEVP